MTVMVVIVVARLALPLLIPRFPLPAIIAVLIVDAADQSVLQLPEFNLAERYQTFDKALDIYYLTIAYASTIRNWDTGFAFEMGRVLWYYRLIGVALFEWIEARWLLLLFPNVFEFYFVAVESIKVAGNPFVLTRRQQAAIAAFIWIFIKLPQEWWLHVARLDFTDALKERLFGVPADSPWRAAVGNRPCAALIILGGAAVIALVVCVSSRRLPQRAWRPTFSADVQAHRLGWSTRPPGAAIPARFFGWQFVEKAALVSLVTLIFRHILPGRHNMLQAFVGTLALIAASTFVSQWLARRGVTWRWVAIQFLTLAATNTAIGLAVGLLLSSPDTRTPVGVLLFLVALLTLIIVLFDRFKGLEGRRPAVRPSRSEPALG